MSIITIFHVAVGAGRTVAERVAEILSYRCISREVLIKASERYGIAEAKLFVVLEEMPHCWCAHWIERRELYRAALQAARGELALGANAFWATDQVKAHG